MTPDAPLEPGTNPDGTTDAAMPPASRRPRGGEAAPRRAGGASKGTGSAVRPRRARPDPIRTWVRRVTRSRPGLMRDVLTGLEAVHGKPVWVPRYDPTSELVLTILTQNSADINAEKAFEALRLRYPQAALDGAPPAPGGAVALPGGTVAAAGGAAADGAAADGAAADPAPDARSVSDALPERPPPGWGGKGLRAAAAPDWGAVEHAPLDELTDVIRPGGLAPQKAPRIQAALRTLRESNGDYSLEFLGEMSGEDAVAWLTAIPGIGRKTASVVLLFSFGTPLMPVDRHVERVAKRIGLVAPKQTADQAHDVFLRLLEPDEMYEAHVNLITHGRVICTAQRPAHERCPVAPRCRFIDPKAP